MKQLLQNIRDGKAEVAEIPVPKPTHKTALIKTSASLVSAGTERTVVEFAEKNLLGKAASRPDLVKQVLDKAKREGILPTIQSAFNRLNEPMALGYSSSGTIIKTGPGLEGFAVGDRVACAGSGFAVHAEYAVVPQNLMTKIPDNLDFESAAFTTLGAIAMQGFRLANLQLGSNVAIIGLGLLGLLTVDIARAAGCHILGIDIDESRVNQAKNKGIETCLNNEAGDKTPVFTHGKGFDAVLICADTKSSEPVELAGEIARDRGVVVAVGAVGFNIPRRPYYYKELSFLVSRSYGPGRYDAQYEENGIDYPAGYIRWTEGRNMQSVVELLSTNQIDAQSLISHRIPIESATKAYDLISGKLKEPFMGVLLTYPDTVEKQDTRVILSEKRRSVSNVSGLKLGVLGAGSFARAVFLPVIKKSKRTENIGLVSGRGLNAQQAGKNFGFQYASANEDDVLTDPEINLVTLLTRHDQHVKQIKKAVSNNKHVYCEKPLVVNDEELKDLYSVYQEGENPLLMVGFNRRFAPLAVKLKKFFNPCKEPMMVNYRVNAGYIKLDHWLHDSVQGGGRIIGEGCHFIDFLSFMIGDIPSLVSAHQLPNFGKYNQDNIHLVFEYPNGSIGTVTYLANGDKSVPKEYVEVFCEGRVGILNDYRSLQLVKNGSTKKHRSAFSQDKGHFNSWNTFLDAIEKNENPPIPYRDMFGVTLASIKAVESLQKHNQVSISLDDLI